MLIQKHLLKTRINLIWKRAYIPHIRSLSFFLFLYIFLLFFHFFLFSFLSTSHYNVLFLILLLYLLLVNCINLRCRWFLSPFLIRMPSTTLNLPDKLPPSFDFCNFCKIVKKCYAIFSVGSCWSKVVIHSSMKKHLNALNNNLSYLS